MTLPSPETEEEDTKQHDTDPQETSTCINHPRELEKGGSKKISNTIKAFLDLITLIGGNLHDISDTVEDVTAEVLQQFEQKKKIILGAI